VASYSVVIKRSAANELEDVPRKDRVRIIERIQALASEPRPAGAEKLAGNDKYRIRQGTYRVVYEIDDKIVVVTVVKVAHRRDVYR
jgi:mRNA interferase RelE/StbE